MHNTKQMIKRVWLKAPKYQVSGETTDSTQVPAINVMWMLDRGVWFIVMGEIAPLQLEILLDC